jgi:hypothetical protein
MIRITRREMLATMVLLLSAGMSFGAWLVLLVTQIFSR